MAAKYLYFDPGSNNAITLPVDQLRGIDQIDDTSVVLKFGDVDDTNGVTTEVDLTVTTAKEKDVMQNISDAIAFGKDQFLVVADSVNNDFVSPDISAVTVSTGGSGLSAGSGITSGSGTVYHSFIEGLGGGVIKTSIFVDLTGLASSADGDVIGKAGTANSHIGQYTVAKSGTLFAGRISYMEIPAGGDPDIELHSADESTLAEDAAITSGTNNTALAQPAVDVAIAQMGPFALSALPSADQFLYLVDGAGTDANYTAGKVLIELFGTV